MSDYIDDVEGAYVDLGQFDSEHAKALSDRSKEEKAVMKIKIRLSLRK